MPDRNPDGVVNPLQAIWLGNIDYSSAWRLQQELVVLRQNGQLPDTLLLLEHPRTITLGRSAVEAHLLEPRDSLRARGVAVVDVDRGGDVTYHGPGQLVGYPILDLEPIGRDLHRYIRNLESAVIRALEVFGIRGGRVPPFTGVWVNERKIAAIGIKVSRWVVSHGFALNVDPDLFDFDSIVPCGIRDKGVTSIAAQIERKLDIQEVIGPVCTSFEETFSHSVQRFSQVQGGLLSDDSEKILQAAIDASEIPVIDYAPLSGGQRNPGLPARGN